MNPSNPAEPAAHWTWADLVSAYSFWALLLVYLASSATFLLYSTLLPYVRNAQGLSVADTGLIFNARNIGGVFAVYLAWLAARWKPKPALLATSLLQLGGFAFVAIPSLAVSPALRLVGAFCWGAGYYALLLAIPAFLAGHVGGAGGFVVTFGAVLTLSRVMQTVLPMLVAALVIDGNAGTGAAAIVLVGPLLLATIVLLTVKPRLFRDPPPRRVRPLPPVRRSPIGAALLCLVPFYVFFWLYRVHGEAASMAPSPALLSSRGAIGASFIPCLLPIMLATLTPLLT